jgi:TonB family protein
MYEEPSPLEWIVVNAVIPSVVVTFLMHPGMPATRHPPPPLPYCGLLLPPLPIPSAGAGRVCPGNLRVTPIGQAGPDALTGPIPVHPDVVLEAAVDSTGRVLSDSIMVVSATNPCFVALAQQALRATRFRPARIGGRAVRMRVREPFEFTLRSGTGRAR